MSSAEARHRSLGKLSPRNRVDTSSTASYEYVRRRHRLRSVRGSTQRDVPDMAQVVKFKWCHTLVTSATVVLTSHPSGSHDLL